MPERRDALIAKMLARAAEGGPAAHAFETIAAYEDSDEPLPPLQQPPDDYEDDLPFGS